MDEYLVPTGYGEAEFIEKKSRFIGHVWCVESEEEALSKIQEMKKQHYDATHNCWAYIIRDGAVRFSDDGEPGGTAGMPMLQVLQREGLYNCVCVVTRYFGGTLLGTGGLVRAYGAAALGALKEANVITYDIYSDYRLTVSYSDYQKIMPVISEFGFRCSNTDYSDNIDIFGKIKKSQSEIFIKRLIETTSDRIKYKLIRECFDY